MECLYCQQKCRDLIGNLYQCDDCPTGAVIRYYQDYFDKPKLLVKSYYVQYKKQWYRFGFDHRHLQFMIQKVLGSYSKGYFDIDQDSNQMPVAKSDTVITLDYLPDIHPTT